MFCLLRVGGVDNGAVLLRSGVPMSAIEYAGLGTLLIGIITIGGIVTICLFLNRIETGPQPRVGRNPCSEVEKQRDFLLKEVVRLEIELKELREKYKDATL